MFVAIIYLKLIRPLSRDDGHILQVHTPHTNGQDKFVLSTHVALTMNLSDIQMNFCQMVETR